MWGVFVYERDRETDGDTERKRERLRVEATVCQPIPCQSLCWDPQAPLQRPSFRARVCPTTGQVELCTRDGLPALPHPFAIPAALLWPER